MDFHEDGGVQLTLNHLSGRDYVGLKIFCSGCRKGGVYAVAEVAAKLKAQGRGGHSTKIEELPGLISGPCRKCKAKRWEVQVLWYDPQAKPPQWRTALSEKLAVRDQR